MSRIRIKRCVLFFLFFYCTYVIGATSTTPTAYTSSTSIAPSIQAAPIPSPSTLQAKSSYTQVAAIPSDPKDFVSHTANECGSSETKESCYVRYTVKKQNNPPPGSPQYVLANSNLQCPAGYYGVAAFDNRVIDYAQRNLFNPDTIYYYEALKFYPVTQSQYNAYTSSGNFSCVAPPDGPIVRSGRKCIENTCGGAAADYVVVDGFMAKKVTPTPSSYFRQDTYSKYNNKCEHFTDPGCPDWCGSKWKWESYQYQNVKCTRAAGFYRANTSLPEIVAAISPLYTPSVVICSKPKIAWH